MPELRAARWPPPANPPDETLIDTIQRLRHSPNDRMLLTKAGAALRQKGRIPEAIAFLETAFECRDGKEQDVLKSLWEAYVEAGQPWKAQGLLPDFAGNDILEADRVIRVALKFLKSQDRAGAIECLIDGCRFLSNEPRLVNMARQIHKLRPKVAFFCESGDLKFLGDIYRFTQARFETRFFSGTTPDDMAAMLDWCDVAWFEWCTNQLVLATQLPKTCRIICRLHRYEAFRDWPKQVVWENVDVLITVGNRFVLDHIKKKVPGLEEQTELMTNFNGVNLDRFAFKNRERGKNIACLGYIHLRKNPMFLLQCFHELHRIDPNYRLFFGGPFEDDGVLEQYLNYMIKELKLDGSVSFDGYQEDVPAWLEDKHFLVSAAIGEGHPVNVIEGMACGVKPIIHTWPGARDLFPQELLFRTPEEFCRRIHDDPYQPMEYRQHVKSHYSLAGQLGQLNDLLIRFEGSLNSTSETAGGVTSNSGENRTYERVRTQEESLDGVKYYDRRWDGSGVGENTFERARRQKVIEAVQGLKRDDLRIVNLGCGRGIIEPHLCKFGRVVGVDFSRTGIRLAQQACPKGTFICSDFFHVVLPPRAYDVVVSVEVIEHLEDDSQARYLDLAYELLAPGGMLVLTTPNRPQMAKLNEAHIAETGRPWSDQPIENWCRAEEIHDRVTLAGFRVQTVETFLSRKELEGLHLYVVAGKPD